MRISGFSIVKIGDRLGYPYKEALLSLAPFVDEIVVAHGDSTDSTRKSLQSLALEIDKPLRIIDSPWDSTNTRGGTELSRQTNIALEACHYDIAFYIQADEVLCETDGEQLKEDLVRFSRDSEVGAMALTWEHFYGHYDTVVRNREWYRREIRIVKRSAGWRSFGDAQGFRIRDSARWIKGPAALSSARVFHYGWVRPPDVMIQKSIELDRLWHGHHRDTVHSSATIFPEHVGLEKFQGNHPRVMESRIMSTKGRVSFTRNESHHFFRKLRLQVSRWIEDQTGWRPGEFTNYSKLKRYSRIESRPTG
jgi:hypothetical protein